MRSLYVSSFAILRKQSKLFQVISFGAANEASAQRTIRVSHRLGASIESCRITLVLFEQHHSWLGLFLYWSKMELVWILNTDAYLWLDEEARDRWGSWLIPRSWCRVLITSAGCDMTVATIPDTIPDIICVTTETKARERKRYKVHTHGSGKDASFLNWRKSGFERYLTQKQMKRIRSRGPRGFEEMTIF